MDELSHVATFQHEDAYESLIASYLSRPLTWDLLPALGDLVDAFEDEFDLGFSAKEHSELVYNQDALEIKIRASGLEI